MQIHKNEKRGNMIKKRHLYSLLFFLCFLISCSKKNNNFSPDDIKKINSFIITDKLSSDKISYKKEELKIDLTLGKNDFSQLIGFNDKNIFYRIDTSSLDNLDFINYSYYCYNRISMKSQLLYTTQNCSNIVLEEIYNNDLIIVEVYFDTNMSFKIKRINNTQENTLLSEICNGIPIASLIGNKIVFNYQYSQSDIFYQPLGYINLDNNKYTQLKNPKYYFTDDSNITGTVLQSVDGCNNGFIYECISFNDENMILDSTGKSQLFYFDFNKNKSYNLPIDFPNKYTYVAGDYKNFITSKYAFKQPLDNTGQLYVLNNNTYYKYIIPGICSSNDVIKCYILSNGYILLKTQKSSYIIDITDKKCNDLSVTNTIKVYQNTIAYMNNNTIYFFNYSM